MKNKILNSGIILPAAGLAFLLTLTSCSSLSQARPRWDQKEAVRKVKAVKNQEEAGALDWDKIPWHSDPDEAARIAAREQKPIFVFFFLRKNVGPAAAPC